MKYTIATICLLAACLPACKKEPGIGGDAEITGRVWVRDYNSTMTNVIGEYAAEDEYVYIVFGDHRGYDKRIKTDYNGYFRFNHLYPGDYTIYVYSTDTTLTELDEQVPVIVKVNVEDKDSSVDLGLINIAK